MKNQQNQTSQFKTAIAETYLGHPHGSSGKYKASHSRQQPKVSLDRIAQSSFWNIKDLCNGYPVIPLAQNAKLHKKKSFSHAPSVWSIHRLKH